MKSATWILAITILVFLSACSDKEQSVMDSYQEKPIAIPASSLTSTSSVISASSVVPASGVSGKALTQNMTAAAILAAFNKDISVCHSLVKLHKPDQQQNNQQTATAAGILNEPPYVGSAEADYINKNQQYFDIDESYEGYPWTISRFEGQEQIYCALTKKRLEEIEALGESEEAWQIRKFFLNIELETLENVSGLGPGGNVVDWNWWSSELEKVSGFYATTQRSEFVEWAQKAVPSIEEERKVIQNDVDQMYPKGSKENKLEAVKLNKMVDERVAFIKSLLATKK